VDTWFAPLLWPAVGFSVAIVALLIFKPEIRALIPRVRDAKLPGGGIVSFSSTPDLVIDAEQVKARPYNLFWAGHDIGVLISLLEANGSQEQIRLVSQQVINHLRELDLKVNLYRGSQRTTQYIVETAHSRAIIIFNRISYQEHTEDFRAEALSMAHELRLSLGQYLEMLQKAA
jgi:hypothetical protein